MKKINLILALTFLGFLGCNTEDFLTIPPETELTSETAFVTQADFEAAVNGIYAPLRGLYNNAFFMGEMHSDNAYYIHNPGYRADIDQEQIANFIYDANSGIANGKYVNNYQIISRANQVLARIDDADIPAGVKDNLKGQALFLRALSYMELVQFFGEVPLHTDPVTTLDGVALPLSPVADVYAQIVSDASEAASLLPTKSSQEAGRATSGAANALLGNAYLNMGQYGQAETALRAVVNSGQYQLLTDYADVFDPSNKNNTESVFEIQYKEGTEGYASGFFYNMAPEPISAPDLAALMSAEGVNPGNIQALTQTGFNTPTPNLINAYEAGDARADVNIGYAMANGVMRPYVKKYLHPHATAPRTNDNWPVYRYSGVLLLLAEALEMQTTNSAEALTLINQVRTRAGLAGLATSSMDAILQERRVELAFENKRWLDLVRTGRAVSVITAYGAEINANPQDYYFPANIGPVPAAFADIRTTFPFPAGEDQIRPDF